MHENKKSFIIENNIINIHFARKQKINTKVKINFTQQKIFSA